MTLSKKLLELESALSVSAGPMPPPWSDAERAELAKVLGDIKSGKYVAGTGDNIPPWPPEKIEELEAKLDTHFGAKPANHFNQDIYSDKIKYWIPDIGEYDLKFLCNKAANQYKALDDGCVDNFRASRNHFFKWSGRYQLARSKGCCGFSDERYWNPKTHNEFWIGFNYGH